MIFDDRASLHHILGWGRVVVEGITDGKVGFVIFHHMFWKENRTWPVWAEENVKSSSSPGVSRDICSAGQHSAHWDIRTLLQQWRHSALRSLQRFSVYFFFDHTTSRPRQAWNLVCLVASSQSFAAQKVQKGWRLCEDLRYVRYCVVQTLRLKDMTH